MKTNKHKKEIIKQNKEPQEEIVRDQNFGPKPKRVKIESDQVLNYFISIQKHEAGLTVYKII